MPRLATVPVLVGGLVLLAACSTSASPTAHPAQSAAWTGAATASDAPSDAPSSAPPAPSTTDPGEAAPPAAPADPTAVAPATPGVLVPPEKTAVDGKALIAAAVGAMKPARTYQVHVYKNTAAQTLGAFGAVDKTDPRDPRLEVSVTDPTVGPKVMQNWFFGGRIYTQKLDSPDILEVEPAKAPVRTQQFVQLFLDPTRALTALDLTGMDVTYVGEQPDCDGSVHRYSVRPHGMAPGSPLPKNVRGYEIELDDKMRLCMLTDQSVLRTDGTVSMRGYDTDVKVFIPPASLIRRAH